MDKQDERPGVQADGVNSEPQNKADESPQPRQPIDELDKPRTYGDAAHALGVPYHVVQRAARRGLVPPYRLGTSRRYVKLRDFFDLMDRNANADRRVARQLPKQSAEFTPQRKASRGTGSACLREPT